MKKKCSVFRVALCLCAALGWWGLLYPELALTPDTVKVTVEDVEGNLDTQPLEWSLDGSLYFDLLEAGHDKITFRSKLLTNLLNFWFSIQP